MADVRVKMNFRIDLYHWLQYIILMHSQEQPSINHTKILEVLRSKQLKKSAKDPRQHLYFKIKPQKSSTELIINYKDLKDNFPYALIDFYESKMKTVPANGDGSQNQVIQKEKEKKSINSKSLETKLIKNHAQNHSTQKHSEKQEKIMLEGEQTNKEQQDIELIYDYDKYTQDNERPFKLFYTAFSEDHLVQNRYLNDLKNGNGSYGRKGQKQQNLDVKRKKPRVDYSEE